MEKTTLDSLLVPQPMKMRPMDESILDLEITRAQIHIMVEKETLTYFSTTSNGGLLKDSMMLSSTCNGPCCCRQSGQVDVDPAAAATAQEKYELDSVYHLRMSYWCYRIVDCFGISREFVAIAFDYLNRFIATNVFPW